MQSQAPATRPYPTLIGVAASVVFAIAAIGLQSGCPNSGGDSGGDVIGESDENHLRDAMELLPRLGEVDPDRGAGSMQYHLNRWYAAAEPASDWKVDPLFERLPDRYEFINDKNVAQLDRDIFSQGDIFYLRECFWAREAGAWIVKTPADPSLARWTEAKENASEDDLFIEELQRSPLEETVRLFDWTIRNVRLQKMPEQPREQVGPQSSGGVRAMLPAERGIPGPGYSLLPWQSLLFGRGDAWERARVFIQLLRQRGVTAVMVGIDEGSATGRATPWAVGVLLGDDIYLFDPRMGLPLPGPGARGVATLKQVTEDPAILKQCDITTGGETIPYAIDADDISRIVIMVDAPAESLSQRMATLEMALTGGDRLVLTVSPEKIADRIAKLGWDRVRLWRVPIEATIYRHQFMMRINAFRYAEDKSRDPALIRLNSYYVSQELIFRDARPFARARDLHLRGVLDNRPDRDGAKIFYMSARVPDSLLERIPKSVELQQQVGIYEIARAQKTEELRKQYLEDTVASLRRSKELCNQFLTLIQYDQGNYDAAINWAQRAEQSSEDLAAYLEASTANIEGISDEQRAEILKQAQESRNELFAWSRSIHARALEAKGKFVEVKVMMRTIESPQREGNLLRAQWAGRKPGQPLSANASNETEPTSGVETNEGEESPPTPE